MERDAACTRQAPGSYSSLDHGSQGLPGIRVWRSGLESGLGDAAARTDIQAVTMRKPARQSVWNRVEGPDKGHMQMYLYVTCACAYLS